jgi:lysophospholipase II
LEVLHNDIQVSKYSPSLTTTPALGFASRNFCYPNIKRFPSIHIYIPSTLTKPLPQLPYHTGFVTSGRAMSTSYPQETSPPPYILPPISPTDHTNTLILLHGRSSSATQFANDVFSHRLSSGQTLREALPTFRFVFAESGLRWQSAARSRPQEDDKDKDKDSNQDHGNEKEIEKQEREQGRWLNHSWFDLYSLVDVEERAEMQIEGLGERVGQMQEIVQEEVSRLGGRREKLFVGGFSQGGATVMCCLLSGCLNGLSAAHGAGSPGGRLGGVLGLSTILPFASEVRDVVSREQKEQRSNAKVMEAVAERIAEKLQVPARTDDENGTREQSVLETPVFLAHGTDDELVDISLGRGLRDIFQSLGLSVEWHEYSGMERNGHWIKEPEEFDDILEFIRTNTAMS